MNLFRVFSILSFSNYIKHNSLLCLYGFHVEFNDICYIKDVLFLCFQTNIAHRCDTEPVSRAHCSSMSCFAVFWWITPNPDVLLLCALGSSPAKRHRNHSPSKTMAQTFTGPSCIYIIKQIKSLLQLNLVSGFSSTSLLVHPQCTTSLWHAASVRYMLNSALAQTSKLYFMDTIK